MLKFSSNNTDKCLRSHCNEVYVSGKQWVSLIKDHSSLNDITTKSYMPVHVLLKGCGLTDKVCNLYTTINSVKKRPTGKFRVFCKQQFRESLTCISSMKRWIFALSHSKSTFFWNLFLRGKKQLSVSQRALNILVKKVIKEGFSDCLSLWFVHFLIISFLWKLTRTRSVVEFSVWLYMDWCPRWDLRYSALHFCADGKVTMLINATKLLLYNQLLIVLEKSYFCLPCKLTT